MNRFRYKLYEAQEAFYLVSCFEGRHPLVTGCRVLGLRRTQEPPASLAAVLILPPELTRSPEDVANTCKLVAEAHVVIGFVRFLGYYSVILCTKRETCGSINAHSVYCVSSTQIITIAPAPGQRNLLLSLLDNLSRKLNQTSAETAEKRYAGLFQFVDMSKDFYFSYTYDLTRSQQTNRQARSTLGSENMFIWNHYLAREFSTLLPVSSRAIWIVPVIHGFYQQKRFSSFGRSVDIVLIARRSRHFAGTRYLKRGVNDDGFVANDCEIEIVLQTDSALAPSSCPSVASFVQMRGSVPVYWSQETSVTVPKPPIVLHKADPAYTATRRHFLDLVRRYGKAIIVLDLVKQVEKRRRESIIGREFFSAVDFLNADLPQEMKIKYCGLDFSRISSSAKEQLNEPMDKYFADVGVVGSDAPYDILPRSQDGETDPAASDSESKGAARPKEQERTILEELDTIAYFSLHQTGFFSTRLNRLKEMPCVPPQAVQDALKRGALVQRGVLRSNCVDCLDRTNVAQFAVGVKFLESGLYALGFTESAVLHSSSQLLKSFVTMFSEMGDRLALQYGGSEAHKRVASSSQEAAASGQAVSSQGELLTSIKRYYSNSFTDRMKQDAINLFLGAFIPLESAVALWDLESDYHLHHRNAHHSKSASSALRHVQTKEPSVEVEEEDLVAREIEAMDEDEVRSHPLFQRYVAAPGLRPHESLHRMLQSEKRKERARVQMHDAFEREQDEWRRALQLFHATIEGAPSPEFVSSAPPLDWSSFDEVLAHPHNVPKVSEAPLLEYPAELFSPNESPATLPPIDTHHGTSETDADAQQEEVISATRQLSDDVGALIGNYVRGISSRAKHLVGGLIAHTALDPAALTPAPPPSPSKPASRTSVKAAHSSAYSSAADTPADLAAYYGVDAESAALYAAYCAPALDAEPTAANRSFYETSCGGLLVSADDLHGMEKLAADNAVLFTLREGQYAGLPCSTSSREATGLVKLPHHLLQHHLLTPDEIDRRDTSASKLLSDAYCADLERIVSSQSLSPGQHNAIINESLRHISQEQHYNKFIDPDTLAATSSIWSPVAVPDTSAVNGAGDDGKGDQGPTRLLGFTKIGGERYKRDSNPLMIMNESGVEAFVAAVSTQPPARSQFHG